MNDKKSRNIISNVVFKARYTKPGQKAMINIVLLIALCVLSGLLNSKFWTINNFLNICEQIGTQVIILAPFTLLMICGNFDLSVGSTVALTGVVAALLSRVMPLPAAFLIGILIGGLVGVMNAFFVLVLGINSFIATIGSMYIARGTALLLSGGTQVANVAGDFYKLGNTYIGYISIFVIIWVAFVLIFTVVQTNTTLGRYAVATGSDEEAAFLTGVPVKRTRCLCFILTGLAAGISGVMYASQLGSGSPQSASEMEFKCIVAAVVGGVSLDGGEGSVKGSMLGAFVVGVLMNLLNLAKVPSYWQKVALGGVLVIMVAIDVLVFHKKYSFKKLFSKNG